MNKSSYCRPAGLSDEEEDSDIDIWGNPVKAGRNFSKGQHTGMLPKEMPSASKNFKTPDFGPTGLGDEEGDSDTDIWGNPVKAGSDFSKGQHTGMLSKEMPSVSATRTSKLSARKLKSLRYWESIKINELHPVQDPAMDPKNYKFYQSVKQRNMGLAEDNLDRPINEAAYCSIADGDCNVQITPKSKPSTVIDTKETFNSMMEELRKIETIALDVEGHSHHSYLGIIALIQIGTVNMDYIIDPFPLYDEIRKQLKTILEDASTLKLIWDCNNEINWLQRDFKIYLNGILDVQILYKNYSKSQTNPGLETAADTLFNYKLPKNETLADWRRRPLTPSMMEYAQMDVYALFQIWKKLISKVSESQLTSALEDSLVMAEMNYKKKVYPNCFEELKEENKKRAKNNKELLKIMDASLLQFELCHQWRNRYAAIIEESPANVLSTENLISLSSLASNSTKEEILKILRNKSSISSAEVEFQAHTVFRIYNEKYDFMQRMDNCQCHNCKNTGHPAAFCPFPKNPNSAKEWEKQDPAYRAYQNKRRKENKRRNKQLNL